MATESGKAGTPAAKAAPVPVPESETPDVEEAVEDEIDGEEGEEAPPEGEGDAVPVEESEDEEAPPKEEEEETPEDDDSKTFTIDGEQVTLKELKESHAYIPKALEIVKQAKQMHEAAEHTLRSIVEDPPNALFEAFTGAFQGDKQKAYNYLVKNVGAPIINEHMKFIGMTDEQKEAFRQKREAEEYKKRVEAFEAEKKAAAREKNEAEWKTALTEAATKAGLDAGDPDTLEDIARVIVNAMTANQKVDATAAAEKVKKAYMGRLKKHWSTANPEDVPVEFLEKLRKKDLESVKKSRTKPKVAVNSGGADGFVKLPARRDSY